jgi:hypothetical protein
VTLRLKPADLGDLKIRMQLYNGRVEARFEVASDKARALLDRTIGVLRAALEGQGLEVDRLSIHAPPPSQPERDPAPTAAQDESGPAFANNQSNHAGGEPGGHGWHSAESAWGGVEGAESPAADAAAEQDQEWPPDADGSPARRQGPGGAPNVWSGLDAIA